MGSPDACIHAEIRTRIPDTVAWDYHFEHAGNTPVTFTVKVPATPSPFFCGSIPLLRVLTFSTSKLMIHLLKCQSAILKESIDDLEWPGSSIQIHFHPDPPSVIFKGEGHGDLEVCHELLSVIQIASVGVHI